MSSVNFGVWPRLLISLAVLTQMGAHPCVFCKGGRRCCRRNSRPFYTTRCVCRRRTPSQSTRRTGHPQLWWLLQFEGRATRQCGRSIERTLGGKVKYFVTLMNVAFAGASITVSRVCVNRFEKLPYTRQSFNHPTPALAGNFLAGLHCKNAERVRLDRKPSERFPGACLLDYFRIVDHLPSVEPIGVLSGRQYFANCRDGRSADDSRYRYVMFCRIALVMIRGVPSAGLNQRRRSVQFP
jgi:hypothetical protein